MLILGVEPSQRTYKDRMLTDTLYELIKNFTILIYHIILDSKLRRVVIQNMRGYPPLRYGYHIQYYHSMNVYIGV